VRTIAGRPPARSGESKEPVTLSSQARFALALAAGKGAATASRVLGVGGGTSFPGAAARWIDPHVLEKAAAASDARKVVVTGSNGKTTTCRMLAALARAGGLSVSQNRTGSNLLQGVISAAVQATDLRGRMDSQLLLLEVDEATVRLVAPEVRPDTILVTNIFRDQLDRFGELYAMAKMLEAEIEALPASATVVLNGDDPLVASLAPGAPARRLYYGIRTDSADTADSDDTQVPEHSRARRGHHPLRALPAPAELPRRTPVPPGGLPVHGVRERQAGAGHRGDRGPAVAGRRV
jgi:UDP-N-acetylmuramyl tripeptide synthase